MENAPSDSQSAVEFLWLFLHRWNLKRIVEISGTFRWVGNEMKRMMRIVLWHSHVFVPFDPFQLSFCRSKKRGEKFECERWCSAFAFVLDIHRTPQCTSDELFHQPFKWARSTAHTSDWFDWMMINDNYWFDSNAFRHGHGRHRRITFFSFLHSMQILLQNFVYSLKRNSYTTKTVKMCKARCCRVQTECHCWNTSCAAERSQSADTTWFNFMQKQKNEIFIELKSFNPKVRVLIIITTQTHVHSFTVQLVARQLLLLVSSWTW